MASSFAVFLVFSQKHFIIFGPISQVQTHWNIFGTGRAVRLYLSSVQWQDSCRPSPGSPSGGLRLLVISAPTIPSLSDTSPEVTCSYWLRFPSRDSPAVNLASQPGSSHLLASGLQVAHCKGRCPTHRPLWLWPLLPPEPERVQGGSDWVPSLGLSADPLSLPPGAYSW